MRLTVELDRMRIRAFHGLLPQEKQVGNIFEVSIEAWFSPSVSSMEREDIDSTVNYADMADIANQIMSGPCELLETVAIKLMKAIRDRWDFLEGGKVKITKVTPPIPVPMKGASVKIEW